MKIAFNYDDDIGNYIELSLIDFKVKADTYYFAIDDCLSIPPEFQLKKEKYIFDYILKEWKRRMNEAEIGKMDFLPFDFSDQYIGCIKFLKIDKNKFIFSYGYTTKIEGHSICPSNVSKFIITEMDFIQTTKNYEMISDDLFPVNYP